MEKTKFFCEMCEKEYILKHPCQKYCKACRLMSSGKSYKLSSERKFMESHNCCIKNCKEKSKGMANKKFYCSLHYKENINKNEP